MIFKPVKTPCVGICSTGIGDDVCRGCKRFDHEVIEWNAYTHSQRQIIADRLENFLTQVAQNYLHVFDKNLLLVQIKHQQIQFKEDQNEYVWAFDLCRAGASQIDNVAEFGIEIIPNAKHLSLSDIRDKMDQDFYALSCAYYDRCINPRFNLGDVLAKQK